MRTATSVRLVLQAVFSSLVLFSGVVAVEARTLTGVVKDSSGAAVEGADVFVGCGPVWRRTQSNARGEFSLAGLPEERCGVRVERDEFSPERLTVDLAGGDREVSLTLGLRGLATEVAVTPGVMSEEPVSRVPLVTTVTDASEIRARVHQILPQALEGEPGISVQQTTSAQGAPVIRGLIGQQNVLMIDGVRLNTAAWRSGPSQYMAWYGTSLVDRIEVVRGPTSALYGSDAPRPTLPFVRTPPPDSMGWMLRTRLAPVCSDLK